MQKMEEKKVKIERQRPIEEGNKCDPKIWYITCRKLQIVNSIMISMEQCFKG